MKKNKVLKEIEKIAKGDESEIKKLIEILTRQTSEKLTLLNSCVQNDNWEGIKEIAHFLKSNFIILKIQRAIILTEFLCKNAGIKERETKEQVQELIDICQKIIIQLK